jgi:hypothetical protein
LETYVTHVEPFLTWAGDECGARRFADLDIAMVRAYRAREACRTGKHGRRLSPFTVLDSHKALLTFFRWARTEATSSTVASWSSSGRGCRSRRRMSTT